MAQVYHNVMIRFATINIEGQRHLSEVRAFLTEEKPDIVCLQEACNDDIPELARLLGAQAEFITLGKSPEHSTQNWEVDGTWGIAILSTFPVQSSMHAFYKGDASEVPDLVKGNPNAVRRAILVQELDTPEGVLKVATTHFTWTPDGGTTPEQQRDFAQLSSILENTQPDILCGDFNAARGKNPVFDELAQRYQDNIPSHITTTIDPVLHRAKNLQLVVDGIFSGPRVRVENVQVHTGVSDHCAVTAELSL